MKFKTVQKTTMCPVANCTSTKMPRRKNKSTRIPWKRRTMARFMVPINITIGKNTWNLSVLKKYEKIIFFMYKVIFIEKSINLGLSEFASFEGTSNLKNIKFLQFWFRNFHSLNLFNHSIFYDLNLLSFTHFSSLIINFINHFTCP